MSEILVTVDNDAQASVILEAIEKIKGVVKATLKSKTRVKKKERTFDEQTWRDIEQGRKDFAEGKCVELFKTEKDLKEYFGI